MTAEAGSELPYRPCVGITLINPAGLIFAGRRLDASQTKDGAGAWQMPQGGIDAGEKPRVAALRELVEETGVPADLVEFVARTDGWLTYDLPPELLGKVWGGKFKGQKQRWFLYRFKGRDDQVNIVQPHQEFGAWCWIGAEPLLAGIVPFKREVYGKVIDAFRSHLA